MTAPPQLSRIVTVHNQWDYLGWLDDDALFVPGVEFLVVDDASSSDVPPGLRAQFQRRGIRYHRLERNSGRSIARNTGADLAGADYIEFIDGDDRPLPLAWDPGWADSEIVYFPTAAHGPEEPADGATDTKHRLLADPRSPIGYRDPRPASALWRKSTFVKLGGFDARMEPVEDLDLTWRAMSCPAKYASAPKQSYHFHGASRMKGLSTSSGFLRFYLRLPPSERPSAPLIDDEIRNLWLYSTWHLMARGYYRELFRKGCVLLFNVTKASLRNFFARSRS